MKIQFLGATQTVTGSRYLISKGKTKVLVDCGLFQGFKHLRLKNWDKLSFDVSEIDAVLLTHAHLDHSGYLPLLIKSGFNGRIYATQATIDLCSLLLPDSGYLQEEEASFANKHGYSKHSPAKPLYTEEDAKLCMDYFTPIKWKERSSISHPGSTDKIEFEFFPAGHLLGAASILVKGDGKTIVFSGDLGRTDDPVTRVPHFDGNECDDLVIESTYGNKKHLNQDPKAALKEIILKTFNRNGTVIIPSFAVGRAQLVLYYIHQLKLENQIPDIPVYLNSPMASKTNQILGKHSKETKMSLEIINSICHTARVIGSTEESITLNENKTPKIIIAASGMATGGRVLHHLKSFGPDPKNSIVFVGFQAGGTRGDSLVRGAEEIKIHGTFWPMRAEIVQIDSMSAHADADGLLGWISGFKQKPRRVFVTHGEPEAAEEMRRRIEFELEINAVTPEFGQIFDTDLY
ncbi:MAG: MBL fold metallo-hydrolase [Bdellovibrionota bacterium]